MNTRTNSKLFSAMALLVLITMGALLGPAAPPALAATTGDPQQVGFTLEGCRNDGTITLPNANGKFVCPDGAYTTGNLGKGWNELDLVPFRLTAGAGNSAPSSQTYTIAIVVDRENAGNPGYDVLAVPVLNTAKSSNSCTAPSVGDPQILSPGLGGISKSLYRLVTITQANNTTCVYDYYARLALGSHLFPGSSLHANLANQNMGTAGIGARDVSIPVKEILPQEISKDMSASQGTANIWSISKSASKAVLNFGNTCDASSLNQAVSITIAWTKVQSLGGITVITHVYATNPASRVITVNVTDKIYSGTDQSTLVDTATSGDVDVPANSTTLVLTHTKSGIPTGPTSFNDVATATYTDKVTGVAVPGITTASASAAVQVTSGGGDTAVITDAETLTEANPGTHLTFSVGSVTGASGSFSGYSLGAKTKGPVIWTSVTQSGNGSVTFNKTVYLDTPSLTSGTLADTATVTDSNNTQSSANSSTGISSSAVVNLTINKSLAAGMPAGQQQSFSFHIKDANGTQVTATSITFLAGESSKSATVSLAPGSYIISEDPVPGWITDSDKNVNIVLPSCVGAVSFSNTQLGSLQVTKNVSWNGITPDTNQTFQICITGLSYPSGDCKTFGSNGGTQTWSNLLPGSYTVSETNAGNQWTTSVSGSPALVVGGLTATTTVTNTRKLGSLLVTKTVNWNGVTPDTSLFFSICIQGPSYPTTPNCKPTGSSGGQILWTNLIPGSYSVSEDPGSAWDVQVTSSPVTVPTDGGQATASVTNTRKLGSLQVTKSINWNGVAADPGASFQICITGASYPSGNCKDFNATNGLTQTWTNLIPGSYTVNEPNLGSQWTMTTSGSPAAVLGGATATATVTNTRKLGSLQVTKTVNWNGVATDSSKTFQICITGSSYPTTPNCKSIGYNGGTLTWTNLIPGSYTVTETNPGSAWIVLVTGSPATVPADGGQATASVSNTFNPGFAKVIKTVSGAPPTGAQSFTFQLRQGATTISDGTILESANADSTNGGVINFTTKLIPGTTYQLCEIVMPGWLTTLGTFVPGSFNPPDGVAPNPNVDNSILCGNFSVNAGETKTFAINNTPPPGGRALTIGFWKNWASCANSNGKQKPVLDQTLAKAEPAGITIGILTLHGSTLYPNVAPDCLKAVRLLNKSTVDAGKKMSSDPAFNMAAQLLAAQLNFTSGAGKCSAAVNAVNQAQTLLAAVNFDGIKYKKMSSAQITQANTLATALDNYNNNRLCR